MILTLDACLTKFLQSFTRHSPLSLFSSINAFTTLRESPSTQTLCSGKFALIQHNPPQSPRSSARYTSFVWRWIDPATIGWPVSLLITKPTYASSDPVPIGPSMFSFTDEGAGSFHSQCCSSSCLTLTLLNPQLCQVVLSSSAANTSFLSLNCSIDIAIPFSTILRGSSTLSSKIREFRSFQMHQAMLAIVPCLNALVSLTPWPLFCKTLLQSLKLTGLLSMFNWHQASSQHPISNDRLLQLPPCSESK